MKKRLHLQTCIIFKFNDYSIRFAPMQKHPTIMQIIPELGPGGAEQGCIDVGAAIVKAGGRALVVSHGGSRLHELTRTGVTHINMPVHSKNPLTLWWNAWRLEKLITQHGVDIVHVRSRAPAWSAYSACKKTGAHFMTTFHAPYNISSELKRKYNAIMAQGERMIAISHMVADYMQMNYRLNPHNIRLIHRGADLSRFSPAAVSAERVITLAKDWRIPDGSNVVMLPGRLTRWKGQLVLIDAIAKLQRKDIFCIIIGSDQGRSDYRQELEDAIAAHDLGGQIRIVDHCTDMPAAYMLAGAVVSASIEPEGFGRIPIEAQAMGRPIIATDHGGAQETIKRGETGWLVPPADSALMAEAIREALALNNEQRDILAQRAMEHIAENFSVQQMLYKTLSVYNELLQDRGAHLHIEANHA